MTDDLHRHLDGEHPTDALDPGLRREAEAWERMAASFRAAAPHAAPPPWLEQRVMAEIHGLPAPGRLGRALAWLLRPRPMWISPLTAGCVAAAFALVLLLPGRTPGPGPDGLPGGSVAGGPSEPVVYVQFVLTAPSASSVAVAGDFSDWQPSFTLEDPDADGVWSARVPLRPGVHAYMFLVDGSQWRTDPLAERYRDDGFGNRNAILAITAGT